MTKVIISGEGGQGVRVIGHTLATLLVNLDYEVSLLYDYDSSVRGAMSVAYLVFDDKPIDNPMVDDADILLKLSDKADGLPPKKRCAKQASAPTSKFLLSFLEKRDSARRYSAI